MKPTLRLHEKIGALPQEPKALAMDVEHINAIGNSLADLTQRTESLRGYL
jgi:hypothetical protein